MESGGPILSQGESFGHMDVYNADGKDLAIKHSAVPQGLYSCGRLNSELDKLRGNEGKNWLPGGTLRKSSLNYAIKLYTSGCMFCQSSPANDSSKPFPVSLWLEHKQINIKSFVIEPLRWTPFKCAMDLQGHPLRMTGLEDLTKTRRERTVKWRELQK